MSDEFKKCPNGHYYQGDSCPYCTGGASTTNGPAGGQKTNVYGGGGFGGDTQSKTQVYGGGGFGGDTQAKTQVYGGGSGNAQNKTQVYGSTPATEDPTVVSSSMSNRTMFGGDFNEMSSDSLKNSMGPQAYRETRKLVGWLVSYSSTLSEMGVDFKLYEGRNIIGRDGACNITVNDQMVSGQHAVLLFRAGKYSITDQQSSHGTFVNDQDIALEPFYLKDGDVIRMGETKFLFRTSLMA